MTPTKNKLTVMTTVYPPISSADSVRLMRVPAVEKLLRTSDFYMIAVRAQARLRTDVIDSLVEANRRRPGLTLALADDSRFRIGDCRELAPV